MLIDEEDVMSEAAIEKEKECILHGKAHALKRQGMIRLMTYEFV